LLDRQPGPAGPRGPALLSALCRAAADLPRALWTASGDGLLQQWTTFVAPLPGSAAAAAAAAVRPLFRPHADLVRSLGARAYELPPPVREREARQRLEDAVAVGPPHIPGFYGGEEEEEEGEEKEGEEGGKRGVRGGRYSAAAAADALGPASKRARRMATDEEGDAAACASPLPLPAALVRPRYWRQATPAHYAAFADARTAAAQRRDAAVYALHAIAALAALDTSPSSGASTAPAPPSAPATAVCSSGVAAAAAGGEVAASGLAEALAGVPGLLHALVAAADTTIGTTGVALYAANALYRLAGASAAARDALRPLAPAILRAALQGAHASAELHRTYCLLGGASRRGPAAAATGTAAELPGGTGVGGREGSSSGPMELEPALVAAASTDSRA